MKVAINRCYGGFGISDVAFEKLLTLKGIEFESTPADSHLIGNSYYQRGHVGDDEYYLSEYDMTSTRNDPDLIAVIEEMGEAANGGFSELRIVDIPDDVEWTVEEYDGIEWVAEKHRTWS